MSLVAKFKSYFLHSPSVQKCPIPLFMILDSHLSKRMFSFPDVARSLRDALEQGKKRCNAI